MSRLCVAFTRSSRLVERAFGQLRGMLRFAQGRVLCTRRDRPSDVIHDRRDA